MNIKADEQNRRHTHYLAHPPTHLRREGVVPQGAVQPRLGLRGGGAVMQGAAAVVCMVGVLFLVG